MPPEPHGGYPLCKAAIELILKCEGLRLYSYPDIGGVWTIGYGHTGTEVVPGMIWTRETAERQFFADLRGFILGVRKACKIPPTENQLGAMVSLAYNIGMGWEGKKPTVAKEGFRQSTTLLRHNQGRHVEAAEAFGKWIKVNGKDSAGLKTRREMERKLYLEADK